jgi:hypothetical protein
MWLLAAIYLHNRIFVITWEGAHDPARALRIFDVVFYGVLLGWIAPVSVGAWLLWKK